MSTLNGAAAAAGRPVLVTDVLRERIVEGELRPAPRCGTWRSPPSWGCPATPCGRRCAPCTTRGWWYSSCTRHRGEDPAAEDVTDIYLARRTLELSAVDASPLAPEPLLDAMEAKVAAAELAVDVEAWDKVGTASLRFTSRWWPCWAAPAWTASSG